MDRATAEATRDAIDVIYEISQLLDTGDTLVIALGLIQQGVNPEGLAKIIQELRQSAQLKNEDTQMHE